MTRPTTFNELPRSDRQGYQAFTINSDVLLRLPIKVAAALLNLAQAADEATGLEVDEGRENWRSVGTATFRVPLTEDERKTRITNAQRAWDRYSEQYETVTSGGKLDGYVWRWGLDKWARDEGREPIDWDAYDAMYGNEEN